MRRYEGVGAGAVPWGEILDDGRLFIGIVSGLVAWTPPKKLYSFCPKEISKLPCVPHPTLFQLLLQSPDPWVRLAV